MKREMNKSYIILSDKCKSFFAKMEINAFVCVCVCVGDII